MKVRITDLPQEGRSLNGSLSATNLNSRLKEGRDCDIAFVKDPQVSLTVTPIGGDGAKTSNAEIKGEIIAEYSQLCGRCSDPKSQILKTAVHYTLTQSDPPSPPPSSRSPRGTSQEESDYDNTPLEERQEHSLSGDLGLIYYKGDQADLEEALQESIIVKLSPFWSPPCNQSGECTECRYRLEDVAPIEEGSNVTFGELLKKATIKKRSEKKTRIQ